MLTKTIKLKPAADGSLPVVKTGRISTTQDMSANARHVMIVAAFKSE